VDSQEVRMVERVVSVDDAIDLAMTVNAVTNIPRSLRGVCAILVVPGQGEWTRLTYAIRMFNLHPEIKYLLIAGHTWNEKAFAKLDIPYLRKLGLTRSDGEVRFTDWDNLPNAECRTDEVVVKAHAYHTLEQASWMVEKVQELGITSLALVAPPYHVVRVFLTMLKAFLRHGLEPIPMIPFSVPESLETTSPQNDMPMWDLQPGEFERIRTYREKGDVATLAELRAYLASSQWTAFAALNALYTQNEDSRLI
jgi:hypothetical protein